MKTLALILALALSAAGNALAASHAHDHQHASQQDATHSSTGVLKAVKPGKVQIAHDPVPSLQWPAMTMWFEIGTPPAGIKTGDPVRFEMKQRNDKKWQVEKIEKR